jgi:acetyl-CoA carboxylase biotin carboxyl carrier protein
MKYPEPKPEVSPDAAAIDIDLVTSLAQLVARLGLSEIEIKKGDLKVRVAKLLSASAPVTLSHAAPQQPAKGETGNKGPASAEDSGTVKSPMVGTIYLRSSPESPPFVEVGMKVKPGDKLLLVEAMKTFNEILAPREGTVTSILVEDGQPVEYGQPLLVIE